jgi:hypothetical protein
MTTTAGALTAAVDAVVGQDLSALTVAQLQEAVAVAGPQAQRLAGFTALASSALSVRVGGQLPTDAGGSRSVAGWVAETTSETASAAGRLIAMATRLQRSLPGVAAALLDGRVGLAQAEILTRLVGRIPDDALAEAEPNLILTAQVFDPVQLTAYVRHLLATWVEPELEDEEAAATRNRYLKTRVEKDGSLWGSFRIAAGDAETVLTTIEPLARPAGREDDRSAAQRRADALIEVCEQVLRHGELPDAGGQRPRLTYVLPADWAARQAEKDHCPHCVRCSEHLPMSFADLVAAGVPEAHADQAAGAVPAEHACAVAAWTGPQTRARIETILCDARLSRLLLDDLGQITGFESLRDSVTPRQRRALAARDLGCAVRGCTRPPAMCDAHHLRARKEGGDNSNDNLVLLCRRHHVLWHLGKIRLRHLHVPWLTDPLPQPPLRDPSGAVFASVTR